MKTTAMYADRAHRARVHRKDDSAWQASQEARRKRPCAPDPSVLLVVAHPDDEYYCAASIYRLTHELGGIVDQLIITNGEGGYRYSQLAEHVYGHALAQEKIGRARLPAIRRDEAARAGRILGIRRHYFLDQPDVAFTGDLQASIEQVWDRALVEQRLDAVLQTGAYDFVFTVLPTDDTHPHHRAATFLALERVAKLDKAERPVVLGCTYRSSAHTVRPTLPPLAPHPLARVQHEGPTHSFDRRHKFGFDSALDYAVVVHWMMAEYKSQGLFQTTYGAHDAEDFWYFDSNPPVGLARTEALFAALQPDVQPDARPARMRRSSHAA